MAEQPKKTDQSIEEMNTSRGLIDSEIELVLGKIWLLTGTEVSKNDAGLRLCNCVCFIDENFKTKIFDNIQYI